MIHAIPIYLRIFFLYQSNNFLICFFLEIVMCCFIFRTMIHLKLISVCGVRFGPSVIPLHIDAQLFQCYCHRT